MHAAHVQIGHATGQTLRRTRLFAEPRVRRRRARTRLVGGTTSRIRDGATIPTRCRTLHPPAPIHMGSCGANRRPPPHACGGVAGRATRSRARLSNRCCVEVRVRSVAMMGQRPPERTGSAQRSAHDGHPSAPPGSATSSPNRPGPGGGASRPTSTPFPPRPRPSDRGAPGVKGEFPRSCSASPGVLSCRAVWT